MELRSGSTTGSLLATAATVTVNDTSTTPAGATLRSMNYDVSSNDFFNFSESGALTAWIDGINLSAFQVSSTERTAIVNNSAIRSGFSGTGITGTDIDNVINDTIDNWNSALASFITSQTYVALASTTGFFAPTLTVGSSPFTYNTKQYWRGSLRALNVVYRLNTETYLSSGQIDSYAETVTVEVEAQFTLTSGQRAQVKATVVSIYELIKSLLDAVEDNINLRDYYEL